MESTVKILQEDHIYTSDQKLEWFGNGEWVEELDAIRFEYKGYECLVMRIVNQEPYAKEEHYFGGHVNGYVVIPKDHPFYGKNCDEIDFDCHGGITFSECSDTHLIGFDCAHSMDYIPSLEKLRKEFNVFFKSGPVHEGVLSSYFNPTYKNMDFCIKECKSIVDQLIDVKANV